MNRQATNVHVGLVALLVITSFTLVAGTVSAEGAPTVPEVPQGGSCVDIDETGPTPGVVISPSGCRDLIPTP